MPTTDTRAAGRKRPLSDSMLLTKTIIARLTFRHEVTMGGIGGAETYRRGSGASFLTKVTW